MREKDQSKDQKQKILSLCHQLPMPGLKDVCLFLSINNILLHRRYSYSLIYLSSIQMPPLSYLYSHLHYIYIAIFLCNRRLTLTRFQHRERHESASNECWGPNKKLLKAKKQVQINQPSQSTSLKPIESDAIMFLGRRLSVLIFVL